MGKLSEPNRKRGDTKKLTLPRPETDKFTNFENLDKILTNGEKCLLTLQLFSSILIYEKWL